MIKQIKHRQIIETVRAYLPENPIIVEAGAFDGSDTKKMAMQWPIGMIHAFEPVPQNFELLQHNMAGYSNVRCYNYALSDVTGFATFYNAINPAKPDKPCQAGSLLAPKERLSRSPIIYQETIQVPAITLDNWAEQNAIDHIDFLWLDMQGHELAVIKSSPKILARVKAIYTEVHFIEAYEGQSSYQEIKNYLESLGFVMVARDFNEPPAWFFGNALFVRI